MKKIILPIMVALLSGCSQESSAANEGDEKKSNQKLSLNLDVVGDEEAIKRNQENPHNGFCDYYFSKKITNPSDRNSLGFCYARSGDMSKAEINIWQAAKDGDPTAINNKNKMIAEYKKLGIQSFSNQYTGLSVEELLNGQAPLLPPVSNGVFAWKITTLGSAPHGELVLRGGNSTQSSFTVKAWYLDQDNVVRSSVAKIIELPQDMSVSVYLAGDTRFTYPSEGWSYAIEISELMTGRKIYNASGPLPVDYDGTILNGNY